MKEIVDAVKPRQRHHGENNHGECRPKAPASSRSTRPITKWTKRSADAALVEQAAAAAEESAGTIGEAVQAVAIFEHRGRGNRHAAGMAPPAERRRPDRAKNVVRLAKKKSAARAAPVQRRGAGGDRIGRVAAVLKISRRA